jgi:hypothetical protein
VLKGLPPAVGAQAGDDGDGPGIEVVVSGGRRVVVRRGFEVDLLAQVLEVLEGRPRC